MNWNPDSDILEGMKSNVLWVIYILIVVLLGIFIFQETEAVPTLRVDEIAPTKYVFRLIKGKATVPAKNSNKTIVKPAQQ